MFLAFFWHLRHKKLNLSLHNKSKKVNLLPNKLSVGIILGKLTKFFLDKSILFSQSQNCVTKNQLVNK